MRWQFGAVLPPEIKANLCEPEQEFFTKYNRNVFTLKSIKLGETLQKNPHKLKLS